jgi:hypothetical protein
LQYCSGVSWFIGGAQLAHRTGKASDPTLDP